MLNTIIIDDHPPIVEVIKHITDSFNDINVIGCASTKYEIKNLIQNSIDFVILDLKIPEIEWEDLIDEIINSNPSARIMVFSMLTNDWILQKLYNKGVRHFVSKSVSIIEIKKSITAAINNESYFSSDINTRRIGSKQNNSYNFTPTEKKILKLIYNEKSSTQIAAILKISINTVKTHRKRVYDKLSINKVSELIKIVDRQNLLD